MAATTFEITDQVIADIFTTAADPGYGGSEFWASFERGAAPQRLELPLYKEFEDSTGFTYRGEALVNGQVFTVVEHGEFGLPEPRHELTKAKMAEGIRKAAQHFKQTLEQFYEDHDAATADVALQLAVLGEIVYG